LSIPEGDDKVEKYPLMFRTTDALALNKYDMKGYFEFEVDKVINATRGYNPKVELFNVSTRTGEGLQELVDYIENKINERDNKNSTKI
jgi:hydrogenase nickel incorporation protein HypB